MAQLEKLHKCYDRLRQSPSWRFARGLVYLPRTIGRTLRWPLMRAAFHRNGRPRGWLRPLMRHPATERSSAQIPDSILDAQKQMILVVSHPDSILDTQKQTILVVSHDATRSGAPFSR